MKIVLDWDGTVTERDTLVMLLEAFGRPLPDASGSFREVMEAEMASLRLPLEEAVAWLLEHARVRPGFRELALRHRPLVVSGSFEETIRPILAREGVDLEVVANRVDARPNGWRRLVGPLRGSAGRPRLRPRRARGLSRRGGRRVRAFRRLARRRDGSRVTLARGPVAHVWSASYSCR